MKERILVGMNIIIYQFISLFYVFIILQLQKVGYKLCSLLSSWSMHTLWCFLKEFEFLWNRSWKAFIFIGITSNF